MTHYASASTFAVFLLASLVLAVTPGPAVIRELWAVRRQPGGARQHAPARSRAFRDGILVALFNPKTALFFAAFLPQFVDPASSPLAQSLSLSAIFVTIAACTDTMYVLAADRLGPRIAAGRPTLGRYAAAISFIALGVFVACSGARSVK